MKNTFDSFDFIKKHAGKPVVSAVDLGCGPGFTTQMLNMAATAKEVYGFDNSDTLLFSAMEKFPECIFVKHDPASTPFPVKPELMYARFVLSRLPEPVKVVNNWLKELGSGGVLLIEELEDTKTAGELSKGRYDGSVLSNEAAESRDEQSGNVRKMRRLALKKKPAPDYYFDLFI